MTTAAEKIEAARERRRMSKADLSRRAQVPASWVRSFATGKIGKGDPERLRRIAEVLDLNYRELLALTDQLGAVEELERRPVASGAGQSADIAALTAIVQGLVVQLQEERREWREERAEWRDLIRRLLPGGGATLPAEPREAEDDADLRAVHEATRDASGLLPREWKGEGASSLAAVPSPPSAPRGSEVASPRGSSRAPRGR